MHIYLVALSQLPLANKGFGLCALYLWPLSLAHIAQSTHRPCTFPPTQQTALNNAVSGRKGGVANEKWKLLLIKSQSYQQKKQQHEQKLLPHCSRSGSQPPTFPTHFASHPTTHLPNLPHDILAGCHHCKCCSDKIMPACVSGYVEHQHPMLAERKPHRD